jgi:hypothetical protein
MDDPRARYRVQMDRELEAGMDGAWERYLHAASLVERAPEEWEWDRASRRGETATARVRVAARALMIRDRSAAMRLVEHEYRECEQELIRAGCDPLSLRREEPQVSFTHNAWDLIVSGVVA